MDTIVQAIRASRESIEGKKVANLSRPAEDFAEVLEKQVTPDKNEKNLSEVEASNIQSPVPSSNSSPPVLPEPYLLAGNHLNPSAPINSGENGGGEKINPTSEGEALSADSANAAGITANHPGPILPESMEAIIVQLGETALSGKEAIPHSLTGGIQEVNNLSLKNIESPTASLNLNQQQQGRDVLMREPDSRSSLMPEEIVVNSPGGEGRRAENNLIKGSEQFDLLVRADRNPEGDNILFAGRNGEKQITLAMAKEAKDGYAPSQTKPNNLEVYQQVGPRIIWSIKNNTERIRLTLDPPHLGSIYMEISRNKENIKAALWAEKPLTKSALEASHFQIQKIMESEGFKLEKFDVFIRQDMGSFPGHRDDPINRNPWNRPGSGENSQEKTESLETIPNMMIKMSKPGMSYVDVIV
ncbi:MAG: flagellar hook-length control protein FliK [Deltaproteobacteria bacterium]|nr:flagellar hook-length control protein FliK [Deltaproteobacteria bacterium]